MIDINAIYFIREFPTTHQVVDVKKLDGGASADDFLKASQDLSWTSPKFDLRIISGANLKDFFDRVSEAPDIKATSK